MFFQYRFRGKQMHKHCLFHIRNADKIAVMEKGGMKEFGNYNELMELKGSFYELMEMQQG